MNKEQKLTRNLYNKYAMHEWRRLAKDPFHRLEFDTTMRFLKKYLPKKGTVLDAGGGPGRYTIELAKLGYKVVLLDLVSANLEIAKKQIKKAKVEKNVLDVVEGSITDLKMFRDNTFDAVLCLGGPLSHVAPALNRKKAISELTRVAKKNAIVAVSVMGRYGVMMCGPARWVNEIEMDAHYKRFSLTGEDYMWHGGQGYAHYFTLKELEDLMNDKLCVVERVGLEGLATPQQDAMNKMARYHKRAWKNWLKSHEKLCTEPTVVDTSMHFMVMGRKK